MQKITSAIEKRCGEAGILCTVSKNGVIAIRNTTWQCLKKLKIELLCDPAIPLLVYAQND